MLPVVIKPFDGPSAATDSLSLLPDRTVHLWQQPLPSTPDANATLADIAAAEAVVGTDERSHFLRMRGAVRKIGAEYLETAPSELLLGQDALGGWMIGHQCRLRYSVEAAGNHFALVLSAVVPVPLILEAVRADLLLDDLAKGLLEPEEAWQVLIARGEERAEIFFRLWTRSQVCSGRTGREVHSFSPHPGVTGALELPGPEWTLTCFGESSAFAGSIAA